MAKRNKDNLRVKRKYLLWLKDARGLADASLDKSAAAISLYAEWLDGKDFRAFHSERARAFKRHLGSLRNERTGSPLSVSTMNGTLREVKSFFYWLADQPGYKSKICRADADYLTPSRKSEHARRGSLWKPHPSPAQALQVVEKMPTRTVLQRRDRALVSFLFLTGSRDGAAISLSLQNLDLPHRCVHFDGYSVDTKFGKTFSTAFFPFGKQFEDPVVDWVRELVCDHNFGQIDPLFPKTKVGLGASRRFEVLGIDNERWKSAHSAAKIFKQAFRSAGFAPFSPHRVRDTIAELAKDHCRTPEDFKAWSQNMGHDDVLTTFKSYGTVATGRQMELMGRFRKRGPIPDDFDVIE